LLPKDTLLKKRIFVMKKIVRIHLVIMLLLCTMAPSTSHGNWVRLLTSSTPTPNIGVSADLLFFATLGIIGLTTDGMITNPRTRFYTKCGITLLVYAAWRAAGGFRGIQETTKKAALKTKQFFSFGKKDTEAQQPTPVVANNQEPLPQEKVQECSLTTIPASEQSPNQPSPLEKIAIP
jgi:hypothetical protein